MLQPKQSEEYVRRNEFEDLKDLVKELRSDFRKVAAAVIALLLSCLGYMLTHPLVFPSEIRAAGVAQAKETAPHGER